MVEVLVMKELDEEQKQAVIRLLEIQGRIDSGERSDGGESV